MNYKLESRVRSFVDFLKDYDSDTYNGSHLTQDKAEQLLATLLDWLEDHLDGVVIGEYEENI